MEGDEKVCSLDPVRVKPAGVMSVHVSQLPTDFTKYDLIKLFQPVGEALSAYVSPFVPGMAYLFGFVRYDTLEKAEEAIKMFHQTPVGNARIKVTLSKQTMDANQNTIERLTNVSKKPHTSPAVIVQRVEFLTKKDFPDMMNHVRKEKNFIIPGLHSDGPRISLDIQNFRSLCHESGFLEEDEDIRYEPVISVQSSVKSSTPCTIGPSSEIASDSLAQGKSHGIGRGGVLAVIRNNRALPTIGRSCTANH